MKEYSYIDDNDTDDEVVEAKTADICLLLEGTYPYVRGGVSSWVHQLICGLPELTFALVFIGSHRSQYPKMHYDVPENVVSFETFFLAEFSKEDVKKIPKDDGFFEVVDELHDTLKSTYANQSLPVDGVGPFIQYLQRSQGHEAHYFQSSECSWHRICDAYKQNCSDMPFKEYFWGIHAMHLPVFQLLSFAKSKSLVNASIYHSVSTGYAGLLGFFIASLHNKKLLLTEHGIYTKERYIDLYQAEWIKEREPDLPLGVHTEISYMRRLWGRFFEGIGRLTYSSCSQIITLYGDNRRKQIEYGAEPDRIQVIPNGVRLERFTKLIAKRPKHVPPIFGLIGRVVPIKDIKTYIRMVGIVSRVIPEAQGWIIGPEDEDERYAEECHDLVASLELEDTVRFLGFQNIDDILPKLGLMVLSSISEGQPLVILESYAAGLPVLATDVGSCRELIEGGTDEDKALGSAGGVVAIANPQAMANVAIELLTDEERWYKAQQVAIQRVETLYTEQTFINNYRHLYKQEMSHGRHRL